MVADFRADLQQPLEEDQLNMALDTYKPDKAKGTDGWSTALLTLLGCDARQDLLRLFRRCEHEGMWPMCWMASLAKFIPKPDGGERPILLMNLFYRLWVKARGCDLVEWEAEHGSPFDRAIRGSAALRAALSRAMRMEAAVASGKEAAVVMVDCEKFYDNVSLYHLIALAREVKYPRLLLSMGVLRYLSPRFCSAQGHASGAVAIYGTIAPGCGQAVGMTRPLLHGILDWAGKADPAATLEAFVDDLVLVVVTPSVTRVAGATVRMGRTLWEKLGAIGCVVSKAKSQVVCSSKAMQGELQRHMGADRWQVKVHTAAKDLGVDMAAGRKRVVVRVVRARLSALQRRVVKIRRMARVSHRARSLYHQAQPQATWGQEVMGLSPSMLQARRRCAIRSTGLNTTGMSTTNTLACVHGWRKDPASTTLLSQVVAWVEAWRADPRLRREVRDAWPTVVAAVEGPRPWTRVKGPAAALVLTMRRYGWEAIAPDVWVDPRGSHWQLTEQCMNMDLFLDELARDIDAVLWTRASDHWQGMGLQFGGPDQWALQRALSRAKRKDMKIYNMMVKVAGKGCWTRQRCHEQLASRPSPLCPRCGEAAETDFHRWWECPANKELSTNDPEAFSTRVVMHAYRYGSEFPCLAARGLLPVALTTPPPPAEANDGVFAPELATGVRRTWTRIRDAFTDGSGGRHSADPRLRRCGWGFVVLPPPPGWGSEDEGDDLHTGFFECDEEVDAVSVVEFAGHGALGGGVQRVGRAELVAVTQLISTTAGPMKVHVDYKAIVAGYAKGPSKQHRRGWLIFGSIFGMPLLPGRGRSGIGHC